MTTATQSSVREEATKFSYRLKAEFPSLRQDQQLFDVILQEMKRLNISVDSVTEHNFYAGFLSARANGLVHAVSVAEQHAIEQRRAAEQHTQELAEQQRVEQERAEHQHQQDEARQRLISKQNDPRRHMQETYNPLADGVEAAQGVKNILDKAKADFARNEAESIQCFRANGTLDKQATDELRKIIVRVGGQISWRRTAEMRQQAAKQYEHQSRLKRDLRG